MNRSLSAAILAATFGLSAGFAQEVVPVNHGPHHGQVVVQGGHCANGQCGTCNDCIRVNDIKKTQHPVYSCKVKEICVPNCGLFSIFSGCKGGCTKIEVRELVKKYRTDEECVSKCMTAEEAAKHYEAQAKKAAESMPKPAPIPAPTTPPAKLPTGAVNAAPAPSTPIAYSVPETRTSSTFLGFRRD